MKIIEIKEISRMSTPEVFNMNDKRKELVEKMTCDELRACYKIN